MLLRIMDFWTADTNVSVDPAASIFAVNIAITWVDLTFYIREQLEVSCSELGVSWAGTPVIEASSHLPNSLLHLPKTKLLKLSEGNRLGDYEQD
jgi:hypothetical protein